MMASAKIVNNAAGLPVACHTTVKIHDTRHA